MGNNKITPPFYKSEAEEEDDMITGLKWWCGDKRR